MSSIAGKVLCFSGTLSTQTRAEATASARQHGATVKTSVTAAVNILVAGPGAGAKAQAAEIKGIEVWTEEQFNAVIGLTESDTVVAAPSSPASKRKMADVVTAETPPPPAKKAKTTPAAAKTPPAAKTITPATPAAPGGQRRIMSAHAAKLSSTHAVYGDYDVKLMLSDSLHANSNKFYKLQLLKSNENSDQYYVATNWGRLGEPGQSQLKGPFNETRGISEFGKVFRSKTNNAWGASPFVRHGDKYQIVETMEGDADGEGGEDAALGRLTEAQIVKGQTVLAQIRAELEKKSKDTRHAVTVGELSNEFYSLIPTKSGRQRPPKLDNLDIVQEKEGLLEFWLRMGFDDVHTDEVTGSPIAGMLELPVPSSLQAAASRITDKHSIQSSRDRGQQLVKDGYSLLTCPAGNCKAAELYAAIFLYTGNSIYRELNRCLRTEWKSVPKYFPYLRLYSQTMDAMPTRKVTLWRGIAADLWDEYQVGKTITWWSISSCTASKGVAENFMNQLGGGTAATFLTLHTATACDISKLSFFPHEQESLLRPGTKLRVIKRHKVGKVAHIEMQEVVDDDDGEEGKPKAK